MIRSYLKIAWRNIFRQKLFSLINILGLTVSLSAFLMIIQYAGYEKSYDRFHDNADEIYRVNTTRTGNGKVAYRTALSVANTGPFLKGQFGEVDAYTRLLSMRFNFVCAVSYTSNNHTVAFNEKNVYYGDANFFRIFSYPLISGDRSTALSEPFTAVISSRAARKYFGDQDPVGQTIRFINSSEEREFTVTGVLGDLNNPSHLDIDFLFSYPSLTTSAFREEAFDNWDYDGLYTYVKAGSRIPASTLNKKLHTTLRGAEAETPTIDIEMQPVTDIHLTRGLQDEPVGTGNRAVVDLLLFVACSIVILAWINYSNLAIADALRRAQEVGLRKIIGADSWQIIAQFSAQFVLINLLALFLGVALVSLATPALQEVAGLPAGFRPNGLPLLPLLVFFVLGLLAAGGYPAYVLSRLNPGRSILGTYFRGPRHTFTRHLLVGFQFCVSMTLVTVTVIVHSQMDFMREANLGMTIDNTVVVKAPIFTDSTSGFRMETFRDALKGQPKVENVVLSVTVPAGGENSWAAEIKRNQDDKITRSALINVIDRNFTTMYDIQLLAGRDFLPSDYRTWEKFGDQTESVMINESVVDMLGFDSPATAIGETFFWGEDRCRVVGVVNDFHLRSLQNEIKPEVFLLDKNGTHLSIRIDNAAARMDVLTQIESVYRKFFPSDPFEYFFLEDRFADQYQDDRRFSTLITLFSFIALCIAWLGLAGLIAYLLLHRRKEIGIRKVLGATVFSILGMVSKNYITLGLIALVVGMPITYHFVTLWLERFAYHIDPDVWTFGIPGFAVLLATVVVVIGQTVNTAMANPAEAIRNE